MTAARFIARFLRCPVSTEPRTIAETRPDPVLQPWSVREPNWDALGFGSRVEAESRN